MKEFKLKHVKTGRVFYINKPVVTIGRDTACDVVLALGYPSRHHAKISERNGTLLLEDLDSTNGTFVNDQRIFAPTVVSPGDVIKFSTEAFSLLDVDQQNKSVMSGKLSSRTHTRDLPDIDDTIIH